MIPPLRIVLLCIGLLIGSPSGAMTLYSVDDGTSENALGHGASGDFLWGNYFNAIAGARTGSPSTTRSEPSTSTIRSGPPR